MTMEKVVIIIPTYNEAAVIAETVNAVFAVTRKLSAFETHILVFDSASTDATHAIIKSMQLKHNNLHLQTEAQKSGLGAAYLQAMQYALNDLAADIVFEFDADLSHNPKYIPEMLAEIHDCDVVMGSRYVSGGSIPANWGLHRKILSIAGNFIARAILTPAYKDFTSGFRATRKRALKAALPAKFLSNQYAYKLQLLWLLHKNNAKIREYPIVFVDREKGVSKLPANTVIDSLRVVLTLRYYELQRYLKMCLVGFSGMAVQFLIYNILRHYLLPFNASQIAVSAAIVNNFILNSLFTFRHHQPTSIIHKLKTISLFLVYSLAIIYAQSYWLIAGIKIFGSGYIKENIMIVSGMIIGSFLNYFIYSQVVWRDRKKSNSDVLLK